MGSVKRPQASLIQQRLGHPSPSFPVPKAIGTVRFAGRHGVHRASYRSVSSGMKFDDKAEVVPLSHPLVQNLGRNFKLPRTATFEVPAAGSYASTIGSV
jgi:hypothetical protein